MNSAQHIKSPQVLVDDHHLLFGLWEVGFFPTLTLWPEDPRALFAHNLVEAMKISLFKN